MGTEIDRRRLLGGAMGLAAGATLLGAGAPLLTATDAAAATAPGTPGGARTPGGTGTS
ncbi:hypothetical protein JBE27_41430, partial [Streptomyces albiflaviniger]|nr:hypothetical protein [Streptomyces albiflaviniger]